MNFTEGCYAAVIRVSLLYWYLCESVTRNKLIGHKNKRSVEIVAQVTCSDAIFPQHAVLCTSYELQMDSRNAASYLYNVKELNAQFECTVCPSIRMYILPPKMRLLIFLYVLLIFWDCGPYFMSRV
jgi:hypothetical protein